jgi:hypothetical protein
VIADGLKATRWVAFTCVHCGKRNRVNVADVPTRLATSKLATELGASAPEAAGGAAWVADEVDIYSDETPTAVLVAAAFPDREAWVQRKYEEGSLRAQVRDLLETHRRFSEGKRVAPDELAEARHNLLAIHTVYELLSPAAELSFDVSSTARLR